MPYRLSYNNYNIKYVLPPIELPKITPNRDFRALVKKNSFLVIDYFSNFNFYIL